MMHKSFETLPFDYFRARAGLGTHSPCLTLRRPHLLGSWFYIDEFADLNPQVNSIIHSFQDVLLSKDVCRLNSTAPKAGN